jgi:cytoskeletal protein RodZ
MNIYIYWMSRTRLLTARRELYSEAVGLGSNLLKNKEKKKKEKEEKKEKRTKKNEKKRKKEKQFKLMRCR